METAHHTSSGHSALPKVGWLWKETWRLYGKYFAYFIAVTVPLVALSTFSDAFMNMARFSENSAVGAISFSFLSIVTALCSFLLSLIAPIAMVRAANEARTGTPASVEDLYKYAGKHFWGYIWVMIIASFFSFAAAGLFLIPGLIVNVYVAFAMMAYVVDGRRGMDSLVWSAHAVRNNWWKIVWRLLVLVFTLFLSMAVLFAIAYPLKSIIGGAAWETLFNGLNVFLGNLFILPFTTIFSVLLYTELKKTKHAPSDLDQYRIRRNLWTVAGAGIVVGVAILILGLTIIVPAILDELLDGQRSGMMMRGSTFGR